MLLHRHELTESWMFAYIRPIVQNTMDTSNEHPSKELQSMKSIVHDMMTQLTEATKLSAEQHMKLLQMETKLQLLREKLECHEEASSARSNGAAARKVVQVDQGSCTDPLPDVYSVPVLQAVAVVEELHEEHKKHDEEQTNQTKKRGLGDVQTDKQKKPKTEVGKQTQQNPKPTTSSTTQDPKPKPLTGFFLFQNTVMKNPAYEKEAKVLSGCEFSQRSKYVKSLYDALSADDRAAYKKGSVPTIKAPALANVPAPAGAPPSAKAVGLEAKAIVGKEAKAIETDSDDDYVESWEFGELIKEFKFKFKCFDAKELTPYSVWIIEQLEVAWEFYSSSKDTIFRRMCNQKGIWNMTKFNDLLKNTFEEHLSKPCFLEDEKWDAKVVAAFEAWKKYVPSASLDLFKCDSPLHTCIVSDFVEVQAEMQKLLDSSKSFDWPTFATELLLLCCKQDGNREGDGSNLDREFLLTCVKGKFKHA
jgi:hypothetical protein